VECLFSIAPLPCSRANCNTSRCPPAAAAVHICEATHGQSCHRAHRRTYRCPPLATNKHVLSSHGHPFAFAQASRATDPTNSESVSGTPAVLPARGRSGEATTAASHGWPTCASMARSAGSNRASTSAVKRSGKSSSRSCRGDTPRPRSEGGALSPPTPPRPLGPEVVPAETGAVGRGSGHGASGLRRGHVVGATGAGEKAARKEVRGPAFGGAEKTLKYCGAAQGCQVARTNTVQIFAVAISR